MPSVVPNDTIVGGSTESNELTAPLPRDRPSQTEVISQHTLSEPTGDIDELLEESGGSLGLPAMGTGRLPPPPVPPSFRGPPSSRPAPPSHRPPPPSHRPPPPSHRPPPPSHRPPPPSRRPPPLAQAVAPPRPHLPSGMPVQDYSDLPDLRSEDSVLAQLGIEPASGPPPAHGLFDSPPSSGTPSSRLPAGIVIPNEQDEHVPPPSVSRPAGTDVTQPARRLQSVQPPPTSITAPSASAPALDGNAPPTLVHALTRRVRVGTAIVPLWLPAVLAACAVVLVFGVIATLGIAVGSSGSTVPTASAPAPGSAAPEPPGEPAPAEVAPAPKGLLDKARAGDALAIQELSQKAPAARTVEESLAIGEGQASLRKRELADLAEAAKKEAFLNDAANVKKLLAFVESEETAQQALAVIARLPGPAGPDLLYEIWTGTRKKTPTTELAEALVYSKEVRENASPALAVALDLRTVEDCEKTKEILGRAKEHGDRRSLYLVGKLLRKTGCGDNKRADCYPCLRDGDDVKDALKEVRKRAAPKY